MDVFPLCQGKCAQTLFKESMSHICRYVPLRFGGWIDTSSALGISVYTGEAQEESSGGGSAWSRGNTDSTQPPHGQQHHEAAAPVRQICLVLIAIGVDNKVCCVQFPGSGRTLTTSSGSSMWGGISSGGGYQSQQQDGSLTKEARQALAARRLAALGGSSADTTETSPYFAGATAPPAPQNPSLVSTLKVRN